MKNIKLWIAICIIIFVSGIIGSIFMLNKPHGTVVNIIQDGKIIRTIDLDSAENQTFTVEFDGKEIMLAVTAHGNRPDYFYCGAADSEFSTDTRREAWTCQYYYSLCCLSPESKRNSNNFICQNFSRLCFRGQSFGNCFQSVRWTFMPCRDASDAKGN